MSPAETDTDWRKALHQKWQTPIELLERMVVAAGGTAIKSSERLFTGEANEVHAISCTNGHDLIVRVSHHDEPHFLSEAWAIDQCHRNGIPAPRIRLIEHVEHGDKKMSFCVQERLHGAPMDVWLKSHGAQEVEELTLAAGELVAQYNAITCVGSGALDEHGRGSHPDLGTYLLESLHKEDLAPALRAAESRKLSVALVEQAAALVEQNASRLTSSSGLLHGDYGPKHIFVDEDGDITGIIDWEGCKAGDVAMDFARWEAFFDVGPHRLELLLKGHERVSTMGADFPMRLALCRVRLDLFSLGYYARIQHEPAVEMSWKHLEASTRRLSALSEQGPRS